MGTENVTYDFEIKIKKQKKETSVLQTAKIKDKGLGTNYIMKLKRKCA